MRDPELLVEERHELREPPVYIFRTTRREFLGVMAVRQERRQQRFDRLLRPAAARPKLHQRRVDDDAVEPG